MASKTSATAIRGQYYGIAAAVGKIGAFVGTYVFPIIQDNAPTKVRSGQDPFFVSSSLCIFSAVLAFFFIPHVGQVSIIYDSILFTVRILIWVASRIQSRKRTADSVRCSRKTDTMSRRWA